MKFKLNKQILILSISFLFIFFGFGGIQQYITTFFYESGKLNAGFISLILIYLFFGLSSPLSAIFISKYGAKKSMILGSLFYSLFIFSLLSNLNFIVYIASSLLGIGASLIWMGQYNYLIKVSDPKHYGKNSGLFNLFLAIGITIGIILLGFLIKLFSFKLSFFIYALFPLIGFLLLFKLKNFKSENKKNNFKLIKKSAKNITALRLAIIFFAFHFVFGLTVGIVPIEINKILGITYVGILTSLFYISPILLSYTIGSLSDKFGRKKIIIATYFISFLGLISLYLNKGALLLILGIIFLALNSAIIRVISSPFIGDISTKKNIEYLTALFFIVQQTGVVIALFIAKSVETKLAFIISILAILISLIFVLPLFRFSFNSIKEKLSREIK